MKNIVESIIKKHKDEIEVNPGATQNNILSFERKIGFTLPPDFMSFYTLCNGFACTEDVFNMISLGDIISNRDYGKDWFYFSEYMIYSDMWGLRLTTDGVYEIFNGSYSNIAMTSSLEEFLNRFLKGNVFDAGGLYDWHEELNLKGD